jgi:small subunit ribosomal protein S2
LTATVTIKDLLESGAHYGHQTHRWNPKMKRFIVEERGGIYIIDLAKTIQQIKDAKKVIEDMVTNHKTILFVGTKKQAKEVVKECAQLCGEFFVAERWLGGMLTNLSTIRNSIKTLEKIEKRLETVGDGLTKKEISKLRKAQEKLDRHLMGIRKMRKPPGLLVVVDPGKEHIAVAEAKKLGIPVMGLVDTNCNPDPIDYVIACNDDALKSIKLILKALSSAALEKKKEMNIKILKEGSEKSLLEGEEGSDGKLGVDVEETEEE